MVTDRETKALLKALVDGQLKLAGEVGRLVKEQARTSKEQARTSAELRQLGKRMDKYAAAVVRGFTNGAGRDHAVEKRVDQLEQRVSTLERR